MLEAYASDNWMLVVKEKIIFTVLVIVKFSKTVGAYALHSDKINRR